MAELLTRTETMQQRFGSPPSNGHRALISERCPLPSTLHRKSGFTLIELMLVVAMIGVLSAIASSNYQKVVATSRRSEAFLALSGIYTAQMAYFTTRGRYADTFDELGFQLSGAQRIDERTLQAKHYTYTMTALVQGGVLGANFQAVATGDIDPSDAVLDIVMIENDLTIVE